MYTKTLRFSTPLLSVYLHFSLFLYIWKASATWICNCFLWQQFHQWSFHNDIEIAISGLIIDTLFHTQWFLLQIIITNDETNDILKRVWNHNHQICWSILDYDWLSDRWSTWLRVIMTWWRPGYEYFTPWSSQWCCSHQVQIDLSGCLSTLCDGCYYQRLSISAI